MLSLIGRKIGVSRIYHSDGSADMVSVIEVLDNRIVQVKTPQKDGYAAIQLTTGSQKSQRLSKPLLGHFAKQLVASGKEGVSVKDFLGRKLLENRLKSVDEYACGESIDISYFENAKYVDVSSTSKGKGFQGGIKRHNFRSQDATHGNSLSHRAIGSTGQNQTPGKVFKGKKMPGRMGGERVTCENLRVVKVDLERNLLFVCGSVPGAKGQDVLVRMAYKKASS